MRAEPSSPPSCSRIGSTIRATPGRVSVVEKGKGAIPSGRPVRAANREVFPVFARPVIPRVAIKLPRVDEKHTQHHFFGEGFVANDLGLRRGPAKIRTNENGGDDRRNRLAGTGTR